MLAYLHLTKLTIYWTIPTLMQQQNKTISRRNKEAKGEEVKVKEQIWKRCFVWQLFGLQYVRDGNNHSHQGLNHGTGS